MKCPIVFRATFEQPIGPLNPSRMKMPGPVEVEVFQKTIGPPSQWKARRSGTRAEFDKIAYQSTPATLQGQIEGIFFERQLTSWEAFDADGKLADDEWATDKSGRVFVTELRRTRLAGNRGAPRAEKLKPANLFD